MGDANFGLAVCVCSFLASRLRLGGRPMRILENDCSGGYCSRERGTMMVQVAMVSIALIPSMILHFAPCDEHELF